MTRATRYRLLALPLVLASSAAWVCLGPLPPGLLDPRARESVAVLDRYGNSLWEPLSEAESRSRWLTAAELPQDLVAATLAAEDRRFFRHPGVDPLAVARALWSNLRAGKIVEGGSTLTQQVAKNLLARRRTLAGKLREAVVALRLEHRLSKHEILALYLNLAPYGNQCAGARAAAQTYFGCDVAKLSPAQAAFLAGLPQRPSAFDPYRDLARANRRKEQVLRRMASAGLLDASGYRAALAERLALRRPARPFEAPHFVQRVLAAHPGARRIRTTLDLELQRRVEGILAARRPDLERHGAHNAAVIVLDNETGGVLAWEGSGDYFDGLHGGAIDGVTAPRQPGSALKPFTYALAFEAGLTPATVLPDVPTHFPTAQAGVVYAPRNYDGQYRGPLRARLALAGSTNVPAVWALSRVGVPNLLAFLRDLGFSTFEKNTDYYGFGLTLGDAEVRLDELAAAYAVLARGGLLRSTETVLDCDGRVELRGPRAVRRVLSEKAAFWVADVLSDNDARAFAFGRGGSLEFPFPVAAKTGTSQGYRDNWSFGYTREVTVGVWVGNFDRRPLRGSSGVMGAAPLLHAVLLAAEERVLGRLPGPLDAAVSEPPGLLGTVRICGLSGLAATGACPSTAAERLDAASAPGPCTWHRREEGVTRTLWPAEFRAWAAVRGVAEPAAGGGGRQGLAIESPPDGATYWIDPTLRPEFQTLRLRVRSEDPRARVTWTIDGRPLGASAADGVLPWRLERGEHRLQALGPGGQGDSVRFWVR